MNELIAKSEPKTTLKKHIDDGLLIWKHLKHAFPQSTAITNERFWDLLRTAVVFHDLGKGHSEFQKLLHGDKDNEWKSQRHELFSLPFVSALKMDPIEKILLERVVAGHHKTYAALLTKYNIKENYPKDSENFSDEFSKVDQVAIGELLKCYGEFDLQAVYPEPPIKVIRKFRREKEDGSIQQYFTTLILFGAFKHCDHLASAYIEKLYHLAPPSFDFLSQKRIDLRAKGFDFYDHQTSAAEQVGNIILTAPTGSGKTETALLWLQNQMEKIGQGRVFYTLPFTASINAMFHRLRDSEKGFGVDNVGMLHGKLTAFLYDYFQDESSMQKRKEEIKKIRAQFKTLETPLKILTPFQLLKHLFGLKGFEKGIFEWAGGYFIFDEIHAYDASVFAQIKVLLQFLTQKMQASIFIMTATLPSFLKDHIKEAIGSFQEIQASDQLYQKFDRHLISLKDGLLKENYDWIKNDLEKDKKVLVVTNTIEQAQETFLALQKFAPLLIHGGFNGRDRNEKEKQLEAKEPQLLIGTQAIEVSLDIDYDIIYTEPAPLDALIQRFGRVNRKREKGICQCVVFKERNESDEYIYAQELIDRTLEVLERMRKDHEGIIKESQLQMWIDFVYPGFDETAQERFQTTFDALSISVENHLIPFEHSKDREEDFYKQFDGIKVVPASCEKEYKERLTQFDFIGAELLKVQIRKNWFARWSSDGDLEKDIFVLPQTKRDGELIQITFYVLKKEYDRTLGLRKKIVDKRIFDEEI
ncbi:MAG: CRISPR-associated helicase Cas3' [Bacteroidota bacterium]